MRFPGKSRLTPACDSLISQNCEGTLCADCLGSQPPLLRGQRLSPSFVGIALAGLGFNLVCLPCISGELTMSAVTILNDPLATGGTVDRHPAARHPQQYRDVTRPRAPADLRLADGEPLRSFDIPRPSLMLQLNRRLWFGDAANNPGELWLILQRRARITAFVTQPWAKLTRYYRGCTSREGAICNLP